MVCDGATLVHSRDVPARFNLAVQTTLAGGACLSRSRIARQVRQDVWRALAGLRGFKPVVSVTVAGRDLIVRAGGQVDGPFPKAHAEAELDTILTDPKRRQRWVVYARRGA